MKTILIAAAALCLQISTARSANISSAGIDGTDGGLLKIDNADPYWWFCVQPDKSLGPIAAGPAGYEAPLVSIEYGWTRQTTDRFTFAANASPQVQADLALQVNVIEYVLDTYLPWSETSDRFLENVANPASSTDQSADTNFLNYFYAAQQYIKKMHGKLYDDAASFTNLADFTPKSDFEINSAANAARLNFFNEIVAQVKFLAKGGFFETYTPEHNYAIANTMEAEGSTADYQDLIIVGAPIPEPSAALLGLGSLLLLGNRRRRA